MSMDAARTAGVTRFASRATWPAVGSAWFDGFTLTRGPDGTTVPHRRRRPGGSARRPAQGRRSRNAPHLHHVDLGRHPPSRPLTTYVPAQTHRLLPVAAHVATRRRMNPMRKASLPPACSTSSPSRRRSRSCGSSRRSSTIHAGFVSGHDSNSAVLFGSVFEIITAAAGIGTAVALYAVNRRVSSTAAIGFITTRVVEGVMIIVGVMSVLSVVTLKSDFAGATGSQADSLRITAEALVDARQWTFLLGPGILPAFNALFLGYAMYRSGLVPRILPVIGLIGAPLLLISSTSTIFGGWAQTSGYRLLLRPADRRLGVLPRRLPHLQGLQAHRTHRGGGCLTVHRPARRRPAATDAAGPVASKHVDGLSHRFIAWPGDDCRGRPRDLHPRMGGLAARACVADG